MPRYAVTSLLCSLVLLGGSGLRITSMPVVQVHYSALQQHNPTAVEQTIRTAGERLTMSEMAWPYART